MSVPSVREKDMCSKTGKEGEESVVVLMVMGIGAEILLLDSGEDMLWVVGVRCAVCSVRSSVQRPTWKKSPKVCLGGGERERGISPLQARH